MKSYNILMLLLLCGLFASCERDNFEGPNSQVYGRIIDVANGALVPQDIVNGSTITAYEQGFANPVPQKWYIKNSGDYRNNMVFANTYNFQLLNCNFFPYQENGISIVPGENEIDFTVTPYIRFKECSIFFDEATNRITVNFQIEPGEMTQVFLQSFHLCIFSDQYVCKDVRFSGLIGSVLDIDFGEVAPPASNAIGYPYNGVFYASVEDNPDVFKKGRSYYIRMAAQAKVANVGTVKPNYSETVKITL